MLDSNENNCIAIIIIILIVTIQFLLLLFSSYCYYSVLIVTIQFRQFASPSEATQRIKDLVNAANAVGFVTTFTDAVTNNF